MRKLFIVASAILICQFVNGQVLTAKVFVATQEKPEQVIANTSDVISFIKKWYIMETMIRSIKIEKINKRYMLLAYDSKNNRTLTTRLTIKPEGLYLTALYDLYGCECNCMELGKFKMTKNKIDGCTEGDLTIATAY